MATDDYILLPTRQDRSASETSIKNPLAPISTSDSDPIHHRRRTPPPDGTPTPCALEEAHPTTAHCRKSPSLKASS